MYRYTADKPVGYVDAKGHYYCAECAEKKDVYLTPPVSDEVDQLVYDDNAAYKGDTCDNCGKMPVKSSKKANHKTVIASALDVPGAYEVFSEHFNNAIIEEWEDQGIEVKDQTNEDFDEMLRDIVDQENDLLSIPGAYEVFSEHFNNEVLEEWESQGHSLEEIGDADFDTILEGFVMNAKEKSMYSYNKKGIEKHPIKKIETFWTLNVDGNHEDIDKKLFYDIVKKWGYTHNDWDMLEEFGERMGHPISGWNRDDFNEQGYYDEQLELIETFQVMMEDGGIVVVDSSFRGEWAGYIEAEVTEESPQAEALKDSQWSTESLAKEYKDKVVTSMRGQTCLW